MLLKGFFYFFISIFQISKYDTIKLIKISLSELELLFVQLQT